MRAEPSGWPRTDPATGVPGVERVCGGGHGPDGVVRVEQVRVVPLRAVEVLAQQRQPQVAGEAAGTVAEAALTAGLSQTSNVSVGDGWAGARLVAPRAARSRR